MKQQQSLAQRTKNQQLLPWFHNNNHMHVNKGCFPVIRFSHVRTRTYTRKNLTTCNKSADKPSTRCVRTACSKVVNKLFQTC